MHKNQVKNLWIDLFENIHYNLLCGDIYKVNLSFMTDIFKIFTVRQEGRHERRKI